jgi:branched-subunit amino acid ABC-type transport system permease component
MMLGGEANSIVATVFGTLAAMVAASVLGMLVERVTYRPLRARLALVLLLKPAGLLGKAGIEKV